MSYEYQSFEIIWAWEDSCLSALRDSENQWSTSYKFSKPGWSCDNFVQPISFIVVSNSSFMTVLDLADVHASASRVAFTYYQ